MREVLEDHISPGDLSKKYNISAHSIRDWIKKAGHQLPKSYKRRSTPSTSSGYPPMGAVSQGLSGVTTGAMTPPAIDSPPCSSGGEGSTLSASSSSGSGSGQVSKRIPGKLAMCKSCGFTSEDLAICVRCRRKMPDDVKILDDPSYKPKPDSTELMGTKKLRLARLPGKRNRRPGNPDEPVCIALSSDEEGGDEDENSRSSTAEQTGDQQGRRVGLEEQGRICQLKNLLPLVACFVVHEEQGRTCLPDIFFLLPSLCCWFFVENFPLKFVFQSKPDIV